MKLLRGGSVCEQPWSNLRPPMAVEAGQNGPAVQGFSLPLPTPQPRASVCQRHGHAFGGAGDGAGRGSGGWRQRNGQGANITQSTTRNPRRVSDTLSRATSAPPCVSPRSVAQVGAEHIVSHCFIAVGYMPRHLLCFAARMPHI